MIEMNIINKNLILIFHTISQLQINNAENKYKFKLSNIIKKIFLK